LAGAFLADLFPALGLRLNFLRFEDGLKGLQISFGQHSPHRMLSAPRRVAVVVLVWADLGVEVPVGSYPNLHCAGRRSSAGYTGRASGGVAGFLISAGHSPPSPGCFLLPARRPGLLAQILVSKYEYHQPLYRQEKMFSQQFGAELSRKTMGCWVEQAAELLKPVYRCIREDLLRGNYLQADETPIRYLDPDVKGKSRQGYLWVYSRPGGDVLFEWRVSRSREGPEEFLRNFRGKLQTDGYAAYESLAKERGDLTLIGCWAHARRGFHEALVETKLAAWFVYQIDLLYAVECGVRDKKAGPALRQAMRVWQSQPVLGRLRRAMELVRRRTLPQGLLGQAIDYALKRWEALTRFVEDGVLEIDSNIIENSIRPSALGKKNWLFVGHPGAGERSAVIYTLLGSCRRHGVNSFDYLKDLFTRLPGAEITEIQQFTPAVWAKGRVSNGVAQAA
jgi:transposase